MQASPVCLLTRGSFAGFAHALSAGGAAAAVVTAHGLVRDVQQPLEQKHEKLEASLEVSLRLVAYWFIITLPLLQVPALVAAPERI